MTIYQGTKVPLHRYLDYTNIDIYEIHIASIHKQKNKHKQTNTNTNKQTKKTGEKNEHFPHKMGQGPLPTVLPITR
jgi:hypothetical protein